MPAPGSNWQLLPPFGQGVPGAPVQQGGGGTPSFRNWLDESRSRQTPRIGQAEYPDGYLGTIVTRRGDRVLSSVQDRVSAANTQRGVHKGEIIDPADYKWPADFNPATGLEYQARGLKWTARGNEPVHLAHMGKVNAPSPEQAMAMQRRYGYVPSMRHDGIDPIRADRMRRFLPSWR
ncbi:hypothetical protein [Actinomadura atramentaria]|uniref:hypothetical protein n=1 Tax=Actinomadura atramentaria TaxID=1990 RepID=UPI000376B35C|nr:hypothetical protein [Actinomadura atramentaria]